MRALHVATAAVLLAASGCAGPSRKDEPGQKVAYSLMNVRYAIEMFAMVEHRLPTSLQELTKPSPKSGEPLLRSIPSDPWGTEFRYRAANPENLEYEVTSAGEDRKFDTEDDILAKARAGG